jgi:hypothetical protein
VKNALRSAAVVLRVVEDAVVDPVAGDDFVLPVVALHRQRQLARQTIAIENERLARQTDELLEAEAGELRVEEILDALIGRAEVAAEEARLLSVASEEIAGQVNELLVALVVGDRKTHGGNLEHDHAHQRAAIGHDDLTLGGQTDFAF